MELPIEIHCEICLYLNYEDILNYSDALELDINKILAFQSIITSNITYTLNDAPRINILSISNSNVIEVSDSLLITINCPEDFRLLRRCINLKHANFALPHNKYESVTEFERYLNEFFDALKSTKYKYNELVFRLMYSSDFNDQLGIIMYKGAIDLINAINMIGFDKDSEKHMSDIHFLVNIVRDKISTIPIFYNLYNNDFVYIYENDLVDNYLEKDIIPTIISHTNSIEHLKECHQLEIDEGMYDNYPNIKNINWDDYLIVIIEYRDTDMYIRKPGKHTHELFKILKDIYPDTFIDFNSDIHDFMARLKKIKNALINSYLKDFIDKIRQVYNNDNKLKLDPDTYGVYTMDEYINDLQINDSDDEDTKKLKEQTHQAYHHMKKEMEERIMSENINVDILDMCDSNDDGSVNFMYNKIFEDPKIMDVPGFDVYDNNSANATDDDLD